jgi:dTDP-4-dehydrorhamnose reductase
LSTTAELPRVLVTGSTGQVGGALVDLLTTNPELELWAPTRSELDLTDPDSIRAAVQRFRPRWILNPAAYTAVDKAETEPELARAINAIAPQVFGEEAARIGAVVLHISTDYVFNGAKPTPWVETDPTGPLNVYGATKLAGEQALAASGAAHLIFRTSWVYGATGKNFLLTILRYARERDRLTIVADQHGAPTSSRDLARMLAHVMAHVEAEATATGGDFLAAARATGGVYHASGAGQTTWHGFAAEIVRLGQLSEPGATFARIDPIPTSDYPTPASRPRNSLMDCGKLAHTFGFSFPDWRDSVAQVLAELRTV